MTPPELISTKPPSRHRNRTKAGAGLYDQTNLMALGSGYLSSSYDDLMIQQLAQQQQRILEIKVKPGLSPDHKRGVSQQQRAAQEFVEAFLEQNTSQLDSFNHLPIDSNQLYGNRHQQWKSRHEHRRSNSYDHLIPNSRLQYRNMQPVAVSANSRRVQDLRAKFFLINSFDP